MRSRSAAAFSVVVVVTWLTWETLNLGRGWHRVGSLGSVGDWLSSRARKRRETLLAEPVRCDESRSAVCRAQGWGGARLVMGRGGTRLALFFFDRWLAPAAKRSRWHASKSWKSLAPQQARSEQPGASTRKCRGFPFRQGELRRDTKDAASTCKPATYASLGQGAVTRSTTPSAS